MSTKKKKYVIQTKKLKKENEKTPKTEDFVISFAQILTNKKELDAL